MTRCLSLTLALLICAASSLGIANVNAQDEQPQATSTEGTDAVVILSAEERLEILSREAGTWDAKMTMWLPEFDEPMEAEGVEVNEMFGQSWIISRFSAEMFGTEFEGRGQFGYSDVTGKFIGSWIDTMEPYMTKMEGTWDSETETMTYVGTVLTSESDEPRVSKNVVVYESEDSRKMTMWMKGADGEFVKSMEIQYTRQQ